MGVLTTTSEFVETNFWDFWKTFNSKQVNSYIITYSSLGGDLDGRRRLGNFHVSFGAHYWCTMLCRPIKQKEGGPSNILREVSFVISA